MAEEEPLPVVTGRAWVFTDRLRAAEIGDASGRLFAALDPALAERIESGDVVVGGAEFGEGEGAAVAVAVLRRAAISAVVARSFAPAFAAAARAAGLPAIVVDEMRSVRTGDRLRLDVEGRRIANLSSGDRFPIRGLDDETLEGWRAKRAR